MGLPLVSPQPALIAALLLLPAASPQPLPSACPGLAGPISGMGMGMGMGRALGGAAVDQRFIAMMIPHHEGAIALAELALACSRREPIRDLARRIRSAQAEEIAQMRGWYRQWFGAEVPAWSGCRGWDPAGASASVDVDRFFLERMIPHHRMGVMMASHAQAATRHPQLLSLEAVMVRVQSEEIARMEALYRQWYGTAPVPVGR